jgi:hypothetical protein
MIPTTKQDSSLDTLSVPHLDRFRATSEVHAAETEAPPEAPPQTEPDTAPTEPPPSPEQEPATEPDHIKPTVPLEEPTPDDLPDRTYTTCPVYPKTAPCG